MRDLLIFGATGQVARELARLVPEARFLDRAAVDLSDAEACRSAVLDSGARRIINAAAYTAVDKAESEPDLAHAINATAPGIMAKAAREIDASFVHISTDYVFDGSGNGPWAPSDTPTPLGMYGRTKLAGERAVTAAGGRRAILRTSWVFSAHGQNFVKTMLRLSETRDALNVVDDQIGGPTSAASIARAVLTISEQLHDGTAPSGIYHFSGAPDTNWAGFAQAIFAAASRNVAVTPIPSREYPTPAPRPLNSRLDCALTEQTFGIARSDWRDDLNQTLHELGARD
ncbi:dTDP-4-dehydrorhamnose reductase (plasmid) [Pacificitalea manganoxidans]|uniref:dTDP-4-dehydrorhamnose reductase n=1 Tax=Pacificitalea manganoxidans TaxID=1411902 RepID=A0A291M4Y8_9RHOB|nr:dTDP-4-dehydrorhamnose reductase [Pacificitalea manganoxidans]ATI44043.1 dTDP-4-dehydrorhamnose reductase [Pacificitalea manganoxidans]MDR6310386.1 dTDP-4-dehydrorhamnose reductase [Pacificitalea manganoxidans]